mmetsp:Transcript_60966/g.96096  ORF Transcript_60966/g.96096 Transcript_60966/m.96096 type:complete len:326 (+) Transcript_60966:83-1060(+)
MPSGCGCFSKSSVRVASPGSTHDRVMVPALNRLVSFTASRVGSKPNLSSAGYHVKYNVKDAEIEKFFASSTGDEPQHEKAVALVKTQELKDEHRQLIAAYADGEEVEYYSTSYQRWLHGVVQRLSASGNGYTIVLSQGGQIRQNVGLDLLRPPLQADEQVELFSGRQGGTRLPGVIAADQLPSPTLLGNRVKLEGGKDTFDSIPSVRLKRRFLPSEEIEVYRGGHRGWQLAIVHHTARANGCGENILYPETVDNVESRVRGHETIASSSQMVEKRVSNDCEFSPSQVGLWSLIPVCTELGQQDAPPELVPSYLIRLCKKLNSFEA